MGGGGDLVGEVSEREMALCFGNRPNTFGFFVFHFSGATFIHPPLPEKRAVVRLPRAFNHTGSSASGPLHFFFFQGPYTPTPLTLNPPHPRSNPPWQIHGVTTTTTTTAALVSRYFNVYVARNGSKLSLTSQFIIGRFLPRCRVVRVFYTY